MQPELSLDFPQEMWIKYFPNLWWKQRYVGPALLPSKIMKAQYPTSKQFMLCFRIRLNRDYSVPEAIIWVILNDLRIRIKKSLLDLLSNYTLFEMCTIEHNYY